MRNRRSLARLDQPPISRFRKTTIDDEYRHTRTNPRMS